MQWMYDFNFIYLFLFVMQAAMLVLTKEEFVSIKIKYCICTEKNVFNEK